MKWVMAGFSIFRESLSVAHKIENENLRGNFTFQSNDDFLPSIQTVREMAEEFPLQSPISFSFSFPQEDSFWLF
jgi:hypothetical protein